MTKGNQEIFDYYDLPKRTGPKSRSPKRTGKLGWHWPLIALSLLVIAVSLLLIGRPLKKNRPYKLPVLESKIEHLIAQNQSGQDVYDTVVIGTSRIYRGFDPAAFDEKSAKLGCPVHSYNLGVPGLNIREMEYIITRLEKAAPPSIKTIIYDPIVNPDYVRKAMKSVRGQYLASLYNLPLTIAGIFADTLIDPAADPGTEQPYTITNRLMTTLPIHLSEGFYIGQLSRSLFHKNRYKLRSRFIEDHSENAGFVSFAADPNAVDMAKRAKVFRQKENQDDFTRRVTRLIGNPDFHTDSPGLRTNMITARVKRLEKISNKTEVLFLNSPELTPEARPLFKRVMSALPDRRVFFFGPSDYPELFNPEFWFDHEHFTAKGAKFWSETLAEKRCGS